MPRACAIGRGWSTWSRSGGRARPRQSSATLAGALVHRVDDGAVLVDDDLALDLEAGRDLARRLGEVVREDGELLDRLVGRELRVERVDVPLQRRRELRGPDDGRRPRDVAVDGVALLSLLRQRDERDAIGALVAVDDDLAHERRAGLEGVLERLRRDLLAV